MILKDKVTIITGGNSGIGRETVLLLAREGATVVVAARDCTRGAAVAQEIVDSGGRATFVETDLRNQEQVEGLIPGVLARYGRLDILVNNAGVGNFGNITQTTPAAWDELMDINLKGLYLLSKAAVLQMRKQGGGVIVNVASQLGMVGDADHAAYCASKGGVIQLTRAMAIDHAADNIRVNCVCPGPIMTPMLEGQFDGQPDRQAEIARVTAKVPMGRIGLPEEIAPAIVFLASDAASYITGAIVPVDGGWTAQ